MFVSAVAVCGGKTCYYAFDWVENPKDFATINGNVIPLKDGENKKEAAQKFIKEKQQIKKATNTAQLSSLGKEYTGVKGKEAIDLLRKEKQGFVRDAFYRDDIGNISLVWGDAGRPRTKEGFGLAHIIRRRTEEHQNLERVLSEMQNVIEKGKRYDQDNGKFMIKLDDLFVIVKPQFETRNGEIIDIQFVLSAFEEYKKKEVKSVRGLTHYI